MPKFVLLVTQEGLGHVDPTDKPFGLEMFDRFLHSLEPLPAKPLAICFYTDGVKLLCQGSPALLGLRILQGQGVRLLACRTCLEHFGLIDKVAVGEVGGMNDIVRLLTEADSVLTV
jgi:intracellular sulfur oxidation DsrE/DsrF family protein